MELGAYSLAWIHHRGLRINGHCLWADATRKMECQIQSDLASRCVARENEMVDDWRARALIAVGDNSADEQYCIQLSALF